MGTAVSKGISVAGKRLRERVGYNVRRARTEAGLGQRAVAASSGVDVSSLSKIERGMGNPTLDTLERLAEAIGTDPAALLFSPDFARDEEGEYTPAPFKAS